MKHALLGTLALFATALPAFAAPSAEKAVSEVLVSEQLAAVKSQLSGYQLSDIHVVNPETEADRFEVELTYRLPHTTTLCRLKSSVHYSQMELVGRGGTGFEIREMYQVTVDKNCAP
ncbi:MAG: hypothetical protein AB7G93_05580 [Bdellovibrionales bacterium]